MNVICISASNIRQSGVANSASYHICESIIHSIAHHGGACESRILDLRAYPVTPCIGCGRCYDTHRCADACLQPDI